MSSTPNANTGEIPVPIIPPFCEIKNNGDEFDEIYNNVRNYGRTVSENTDRKKINAYLDPDLRDKKREDLLQNVKEELGNEVCSDDSDNARQYVQMVFLIAVIKKLAADPNCHFKQVSRISQKFENQMRGKEDSWEWVTVHTKEVFS